MVYEAEVCMQPGAMFRSLLYSYIFSAVRLWANKVKCTHGHTQANWSQFSAPQPAASNSLLDFVVAVSLASTFLLILYSSFLSPAHYASPLFVFSSLFLYFCFLGFLIIHSLFFLWNRTARRKINVKLLIVRMVHLKSFANKETEALKGEGTFSR